MCRTIRRRADAARVGARSRRRHAARARHAARSTTRSAGCRRCRSPRAECSRSTSTGSIARSSTRCPHTSRSSPISPPRIDLFDVDDRQTVLMDDGSSITVDVVVMCLGHLDALPDDTGARARRVRGRARPCVRAVRPHRRAGPVGPRSRSRRARRRVRPGLHRSRRARDRGTRRPLPRGTTTGTLTYEPCGFEPMLHVGSRRGVPYRSKMTYRLQAPLAPLPHFLGPDTIAALQASDDSARLLRRRAAARREGDRLGVLPRALRRPSRSHDHDVGGVRAPLRGRPRGHELAALLRCRGHRPERPLRHRHPRSAASRTCSSSTAKPCTGTSPRTSPRTSHAAPTRATAPISPPSP